MIIKKSKNFYITLLLGSVIIIILLLLLFKLIHEKKQNGLKIKRFIKKFINKEKFNKDELDTGDLLCFVSKDSHLIYYPYYITHIAIIIKDNNKLMVLDADFCLNGIYLIDFEEYIKKYCGNIYLLKMNWSNKDKNIINENIRKLILKNNKKINFIEKSGIIDFINILNNNKYSCTGLISDILGERNDTKMPDEMIMENKIESKIRYIKKIKTQDINNSCYYSNGFLNPFITKHVIEF